MSRNFFAFLQRIHFKGTNKNFLLCFFKDLCIIGIMNEIHSQAELKYKEVDFILEWGRKLLAVEVKLTSKPKYADVETL